MRLFLVAVLTGVFSGSCQYGVDDINGVPADPTYNRDIYPLFRDHCLLCHGSPANRGAPSTFRLDVYDDVNGVTGAKSYASMAAWDVMNNKMPPAAEHGDSLGPNGKAMLQKWADNGAPE